MAIDPTAPITPIIPARPAGDAADQAKSMLALARTAIANNAATLGDIAAGGSPTPTDPNTAKPGAGATIANSVGSTAATAPSATSHAPETTPAPPTAAERMNVAVRSAAALAAPIQSGLAPAMANLGAALARSDTPETVRHAAREVLVKALPTSQPVTSTALRQAVQSSGVFLEARMARTASLPEAPTTARGAPEPAAGDMKAALLVLRAVVSTWIAKTPGVATGTPKAPAGREAEPAKTATPMSQGSYVAPRPTGQPPAPLTTPATTPAPSSETLPQIATQPSSTAVTASQSPAQAPATPTTQGARAPTTGVSVAGALSAAPETLQPAPGAPLSELPDATIATLLATPTAARPPSAIPQQPMLMVGLIEEEPLEGEPPPVEDEDSALPVPRGTGYAVAAKPQASTRPPPPYAGGPTTAQPAAASDLPKDMAPADLAQRLLKDVNGAIARQELAQIASLPEGRVEADRTAETKSSRWVFDLPFQTPQGVAVAQFEINTDSGGGGGDGREVERTWRARFSLDVEPLGPVHVQVALTGSVTRVGFWAQRPEAMARLQAGEEALNAALRKVELTPEVAFHAGVPAAAPSGLGRFVDRES